MNIEATSEQIEQARRICAAIEGDNKGYQYLDGSRDEYPAMQAALTAIIQSDQQQAKLAAYAREASKALADMAGGGSEMFTRIGDEYYAEPEPCRQRHREKMANMSKHRSQAVLRKQADAMAAAIRMILPYLEWTIGPESPGYHPTMPSAVAGVYPAYCQYQEGRKDG